MRPTRLELGGFASFRDEVTVDFTDADLFVLSGPTGAGKSSVVDAITFALYGTVPRYDDRRMVAPLISQGRNEARVRLDFTVGSQPYTAVRVVRRTRSGATTKEARLERWRTADGSDTVVVAGTADELTAQVEQLLGLRFEHFTSCIVLPQGAFQQFLHSKPKERQDLLVQLLDLDVYRRVGHAARDRATRHQSTADLLRRRLDGELAGATEDALKEATARVEELDALVADLDGAQPRLDAIREEGTRRRDAATEARRRAQVLESVAVPEGVDRVVRDVTVARDALAAADTALQQATARVEVATTARADAGDPTPLAQQRDRLTERTRLLERVGATDRALGGAREAHAAAEADAEEAATTLAASRGAVHAAERRDLVAAVVADHAVGDPCPVCGRALASLPDVDGGAVDQARRVLQAHERAHQEATAAVQQAANALTRAETQRDEVITRLREVEAAIATAASNGVPDDDAVLQERLGALAALDQQVAEARSEEQAARAGDRAARSRLEEAQAAERAAWDAFDRVWQQVAELSPPAVARDDLAASWVALAGWAAERRPELLAEAERAEADVAATVERWRAESGRLRVACADHGVLVRDGEEPRDAARRDRERAHHRQERVQQQLDEAARVRRDLDEATRQQRLAHELGLHLKTSGFEKWLLSRALRLLVAGATRTLHELSDGAYSLTLDDAGGFAVVDHRNADEVRSARTLSGGETFLASLALALALSEHVADLAAGGAARLECLILDEGFGTLDADTLDVVATALEELGSRGRMVGVITHVGALAQRLPVRYEVRKEAGTSAVQRAAG